MIQKTKNNRSTIRFSTINDIFTDTNLVANVLVCVLCLFRCYWKRYWLFFLVIRSLKFGYCDIVSSRLQSLKTKAVCWHAYLFLSTSWTTNGFILTSLRESRSAASRRGAGVFSRAWKTKALPAIAVGRITQFDSWSRHLASSPLLSPPTVSSEIKLW